MSTELKSMTRKQLERLRGDVDKALARLKKQDMKAARLAAEKAAKAHGFALSELTGGTKPAKAVRKTAKPKAPSVAKYANPADPSQKWTGKGRRPQWFLDAVARGKTPNDLAV